MTICIALDTLQRRGEGRGRGRGRGVVQNMGHLHTIRMDRWWREEEGGLPTQN